jgi:hypothetical protein
MFEKRFQKGFESWQKTHYHVVQYIALYMRGKYDDGILTQVAKKSGMQGLYEIALDWAGEYELNNRGRDIDEDTRAAEVRNFCELKNLQF